MDNSKQQNIYPRLTISHIQDPNRFYAVPLIGFLTKVIMSIPVFFELLFLEIALGFILLINSLVVLFTGRYWNFAYKLLLGVMRLSVKMNLFFIGLTNKYPGFGLEINDLLISFEVEEPKSPSRLFAIPAFGGLLRIILLIPYFIFQSVISSASQIGIFGSFLPVLIFGKYPESTYELARDSTRVGQATLVYLSGLSDSYPSFWISMNHKIIKIVLIVIVIVSSLLNLSSSGFGL